MSREIIQRLRDLLDAYRPVEGEPHGKLDENEPLTSYGIDSISLYDFICLIESDFGISIADVDFNRDNLQSLGSIAQLIERTR